MTTIGEQQRREENQVPPGVPFCLRKQKIEDGKNKRGTIYFINHRDLQNT